MRPKRRLGRAVELLHHSGLGIVAVEARVDILVDLVAGRGAGREATRSRERP